MVHEITSRNNTKPTRNQRHKIGGLFRAISWIISFLFHLVRSDLGGKYGGEK